MRPDFGKPLFESKNKNSRFRDAMLITFAIWAVVGGCALLAMSIR